MEYFFNYKRISFTWCNYKYKEENSRKSILLFFVNDFHFLLKDFITDVVELLFKKNNNATNRINFKCN